MKTRKNYKGGYKNKKVTRSKLSKADAKHFMNIIRAKKNVPIIGILTSPKMYNPYSDKSIKQLEKDKSKFGKCIDMSAYGQSALDAEYVKWIEMGGAIAVPIYYNLPIPLLRYQCSMINGLVIPGGALENIDTHIPEHLYSVIRATQTIVKYCKSQTDLGLMWPVWGTCQGYELLTSIATWKDVEKTRWEKNYPKITDATKKEWAKTMRDDKFTEEEHLRTYLTKQIRIGNQYDKVISEESDPLIFNNKVENPIAKLFTKKEREDISENPCVVFHHSLGFATGTKSYKKMLKSIVPLAWADDHSENKKYIGIMKYKNYPIYGAAFHAEKGILIDPKKDFAMKQRSNLEKGLGSLISLKLSAYFVGLAKKSTNMWMGQPPSYLKKDKYNLNYN